jgi:hypothetical protein
VKQLAPQPAMPATPVTSSSVASATTASTRRHDLATTGSSISKRVTVDFTWLLLLRLGVDVTSQRTFAQAQGHFPRHSRAADQRDLKSAAISGSEIGFALPGSMAVRNDPGGKDNDACHGDPPRLHGPSIQ